MKIAHDLLSKPKVCPLAITAHCLDVDVKTLWNWRAESKTGLPQKKMGRPGYSKEMRRHALFAVGRELHRQGYPGWRAISSGLNSAVPDRLIQTYVRLYKDRRERRRKQRILIHQVRVEVLGRDVIWGQDGTHLGRHPEGRAAIESQVVRDRGSLAIIGLTTGTTADHHDVLKLLEATAGVRFRYPLVYSRDNGSIYQHPSVLAHLEAEQVIVLRSLPRTPEHNGATECSVREVKAVAGLGKGCRTLARHAELKMGAAATRLNKNRMRATKGFKTSDEMDETLPRPESGERARFYKLCRARMKVALGSHKSVRAGRLAEREEVFRTLEEFGFIKRTRGGERYVSKSEIIL